MKLRRSLYARPVNRLRRAVRRGAPWTVERHEPLPGRCRGSGDLAVSHRRAVSGCELASAASTGTIRRPSGSPSCGVVEEVRLLATPFVALSGVHVSHVRVRPVGAVVVRGASWSGDSPLLSAGERPAADGRARLGGDHETGWAPVGWHRNPPWVLSSGQPLTRGRGGTRPGSRKPDELRSLVRQGCMASHETLSSEWIGCGDHA
jgi:hypothetical protein